MSVRRRTHPGLGPRRVALALGALLAGAAPATPAAAHGGYEIAAATDGPYGVVVRASPLTRDGRHVVDLTAYVVRQRIGEPDLSTALVLTLSGPDGRRTVRPQVVGDGYEAIVPVDDPDGWRSWKVEATVTGSDGTAHITGGPIGDPPGAPGWVPWAGAATLLALAAGGLVLRRRREPPDAGDEDDWGVSPG